jgi:DNA (cytosine-5)-methyltransferase 1
VAFSEIEPFPAAVLAHHYPDVPNLGDMANIDGSQYRGKVDVLVGGTPCQAFSVAGRRRGLTDTRGQLTLKFTELADAINPAFTLWENVPGVLSDKTNGFGNLLAALCGADEALETESGRWPRAGLVCGQRRRVAWCILDAQFFGVAQRRRRVFALAVDNNVIADIGERACPASILSIGKSLRGDTPTRRETREEVAGTIEASLGRSRGAGTPLSALCVAIGWSEELTAHIECGATLQRGGQGGRHDGVMTPDMQVRRLTPTECERLQGFPDGYTAIPWKLYQMCQKKGLSYEAELNKRGLRLKGCTVDDCPDGPRYKALGNSMAVPVMRWIGERVVLKTSGIGLTQS